MLVKFILSHGISPPLHLDYFRAKCWALPVRYTLNTVMEREIVVGVNWWSGVWKHRGEGD